MKPKIHTIWAPDFEKTIASHPTFKNMGKILGLTGHNQAFYYKGKFYRASYFPNFGSMTISYWLSEIDSTQKRT